MAVSVTLTPDDLAAVRNRVVPFAGRDDDRLHRLDVRADTDAVVWAATDGFRCAQLPAGTATGAGRFTVPARTIFLAWMMCERRQAPTVAISVWGDEGVVEVSGVSLPFDGASLELAEIGALLDKARAATGGRTIEADSEDLLAAVHGATFRPVFIDESEAPPVIIEVDPAAGELVATAVWEECSDTLATVACRSEEPVRFAVNPVFFNELIAAARQPSVAIVCSPDGDAVWLAGSGGFRGLVMLVTVGVEAFRAEFEALLDNRFPGGRMAGVDGDPGAYVVGYDGCALRVELLDADPVLEQPARVRVSAPVAVKIARSRAVLSEINDFNTNLGGVRLVHKDGGVHVAGEITVEALDGDALVGLGRTVRSVVARVGPMLELVHGPGATEAEPH